MTDQQHDDRAEFDRLMRTKAATSKKEANEHETRVLWWMFQRAAEYARSETVPRSEVRELVEAVCEAKAAEDRHISQEAYDWLVTAEALAAFISDRKDITDE